MPSLTNPLFYRFFWALKPVFLASQKYLKLQMLATLSPGLIIPILSGKVVQWT